MEPIIFERPLKFKTPLKLIKFGLRLKNLSITDRLNIQKFPAEYVSNILTNFNRTFLIKSKGFNFFKGTVSVISSDKGAIPNSQRYPFKLSEPAI